MILLLASFHEFTLFLKIVLWIAVPLIVVSFVLTTILHYRQKRKNASRAPEDLPLPDADEIDFSLVSRLQKEVMQYKRRVRELQHALSFVKSSAPAIPAGAALAPLASQVPVTEAITPPPIEQDPAYLNDLLTEQKTHVQFLQQQLETRIKSYHDLESQLRELSSNLERATLSYEHAQHQLDDTSAELSMIRIERDQQNEKIQRLEASLRELQAQHSQSLKILAEQSFASKPDYLAGQLESRELSEAS